MQVEKDSGQLLSAKYRYKHLVCAYSETVGYIHQSGTGYTFDRNQAWVGNRTQFRTLCERFGHDVESFKLFPVWFLTKLLTDGKNRQLH